jgi:hypothetical protein
VGKIAVTLPAFGVEGTGASPAKAGAHIPVTAIAEQITRSQRFIETTLCLNFSNP